MSTTLHLGIRDAVAALYQAGPALAGGRIYENRRRVLDGRVSSQIQVFRVSSLPARDLVSSYAPIDWTTVIRTVIKARPAGATSAELVADAIAADCYARVMADQTLGGLCSFLDPGEFAWEEDEAEGTVAMVAWDIRIQHRTESHSIT